MTAYISAVGTANPPNQIPQADAARFMAEAMALGTADKRKLQAVYRASGIHYRYSVLEDYSQTYGYYQFFPNTENLEPFPTTRDRMQVYNAAAPKLAATAALNCLQQLPELEPAAITHLITVSCTGLQAPGLDIALVQSLGLPNSVSRTCVNFMGCYAAINALKIASSICVADPHSKVLVVCVELCTLHFQKKPDEDNLLANALFGDGAAAVLVESQQRSGLQLALEEFYCALSLDGIEDMAWHIGDTGFEMRLSSYIPAFIKGGISKLLHGLLRKMPQIGKEKLLYAIHPGGRRILEAVEEALGLQREDNRHAYAVLRRFGNMSSATVLFVLKEILEELGIQATEKNDAAGDSTQQQPNSNYSSSNAGQSIISFAFGPGLTMESMLLKAVYH